MTARTTRTHWLGTILTTLGLACSAGADSILEVHDASLTTYLPSSASAAQDIRPLANQRGVNLDGSGRAGSSFRLALHGNAFGSPWSGPQRIGNLRLDTGTYQILDVDLSFPATIPWPIARSYNARQQTSGGAHRHSDGYQGRDWFQMSQPEIVLYEGATDDEDVLYIVYGADRYIELVRQGTTGAAHDTFKAVNGAAGVVLFEEGADEVADPYTPEQPNTFTYYDQNGTRVVFFGFDTPAGVAAGQIWKILGTDGSSAAYVGDQTLGTDAITSGYNSNGHITTAFDSTGREFNYSYTTIDSVERLTNVRVDKSSSDATVVGEVDYAYYQTGDNTYGANGSLKLVTVTREMSEATDVEFDTYYRYDVAGDGELQLVLGPEGCRNYDWAIDSTLDNDFLTATTGDLKTAAVAFMEHDSSQRIDTAFFNGSCGCSGQVDGELIIAYGTDAGFSGSAGYDEENHSYVRISHPDLSWTLQYFDETGQPLTKVRSSVKPLDGGVAADLEWIWHVERYATAGSNPGGGVKALAPPSASSLWNNTTGTYTTSLSLLRQEFTLSTATDLEGLPEEAETSSGALSYSTTTNATARTLAVGSVTLAKADVTSRVDAASETHTRAATFWSGDAALRPKQVTSTQPAVQTSVNGSGAANATKRYLRDDGTTAFAETASGIFSYTLIEDGLVTKTVRNAKTNSTGVFASGDDPNATWGITETGTGLNLITTYTHDDQGRRTGMTAPDSTVSATHYTSLKDGRLVTLSIPRKVGSTYHGPVGYTVTNHAGKVEAQGMIAFSGGSTTTAPSAWILETESDPISAVDTGTLSRLAVTGYDAAGVAVETSDVFFDLPASLSAATEGTHYDRTTTTYGAGGRVDYVTDATGTITRSEYDDIGRRIRTRVGTTLLNLVTVSETEYDSGNDNGDSLVTKATAFVDGTTTDKRETTFEYDVLNRRVVTITPQGPHSVVKYDAAGRVTARGLYSSSTGLTATTDPTTNATNRVALTETTYDDLGRVARTRRHKISQSNGATTDHIDTDTWRDEDGRAVKVAGDHLTKRVYDENGRLTNTFVLAKDNDSTYADATGGVSGDTVLEERQTIHDTYGKTLMSVVISRFHDDTTSTGALDTDTDNTSVDQTGTPGTDAINGRVQVTMMWYDDDNRLTDTVALGTYGGASLDRDDAAWNSPPARSDTALRTTTTYDDDGTVLETTDPAGIDTRFEYDDRGRRNKTIANYTDGTAGGGANDDQDRIIEIEYTDGLQTKYIAHVPGGTNQETIYTYGVTTSDSEASGLNSNRLLRSIEYPDSSGASDKVFYAYNAQGQRITTKDQAGNVIEDEFDTAGRLTAKRATTIASGFDSAVQAIRYGYDVRSRVTSITQYDDDASTASGDVTDQITIAYEDWGHKWAVRHDFNSEVDASGSVDHYRVRYTYEKSTDGRRGIRRTGYDVFATDSPFGKQIEIDYDYGTNLGINDAASRVETVQHKISGFNIVDLADYRYLGSAALVGITYPEPADDISYSLHSSTSGDYPNIDRFNRPTSSVWTKSVSGGDLDFYDVDIAWDRASQITLVEDNVFAGYDVSYTLDDLNRLTKAEEGTWSGSAITSRTRQQVWELDQLGNWDRDKLDLNGDNDFVDTDEFNLTGTFNAANEQTDRGGNTLVYDAAGNLTDNGDGQKLVYDAFGRLKKVTDDFGFTIAQYRYNGAHQRIAFQYDADGDGGVEVGNNDDPWYYLVHDHNWRPVATVLAVDDGAGTEAGDVGADADDDAKEIFIYHAAGANGMGRMSSYIDAIILRDKDASTGWTTASDGNLEERQYYCQNWRADVVAMVDDSGARVEGARYSAYGVPIGIPRADVNADGTVDSSDASAVSGASGKSVGDVGYEVRLDINLDGDIDSADSAIVTSDNGYTLGRGSLSRDPGSTNGVGSRIGYAGYRWDDAASKWHVRHRVLDATSGRWTRRDPIGFVDGPGVYGYGTSRPLSRVDPTGKSVQLICLGFMHSCYGDAGQPRRPIISPAFVSPCPNDIQLTEEFGADPCPSVATAGGESSGSGITNPAGFVRCLMSLNGPAMGSCNPLSPAEKEEICKSTQDLFAEIAKEGCQYPSIDCKTPEQSDGLCDGGVKAYHACSTDSPGGCGSITICRGTWPVWVPKDAFDRYLPHELIHARQCAQHGKRNPLDQDFAICMELEAYARTSDCDTRDTCCEAACGSVIKTVPGTNRADCEELCEQIAPSCHDGRHGLGPGKYWDPVNEPKLWPQ